MPNLTCIVGEFNTLSWAFIHVKFSGYPRKNEVTYFQRYIKTQKKSYPYNGRILKLLTWIFFINDKKEKTDKIKNNFLAT